MQSGRLITLVSRVTDPLRASTLPSTEAPVASVADVSDMTVPTKVVFVSSVVLLPTCQKTLHGEAPLISETVLLGAVTNVLPALKMKTADGSPCASRVSVPVSCMPEVCVATPLVSVIPPRSWPVTSVTVERPAAESYAATRSACAWLATASATWSAPSVWTSGGMPLTAVPGPTPMSPMTTDGPVLVMLWPASTAKEPAVPRPTVASAAWAGAPIVAIVSPRAPTRPMVLPAREYVGVRRNMGTGLRSSAWGWTPSRITRELLRTVTPYPPNGVDRRIHARSSQPVVTASAYSTGRPSPRAISIRWTSEVPSPISSTLASR